MLLLCWGCNDEHILTDHLPEDDLYTLKLTLRAGDGSGNASLPENRIVSLRLIAFEHIIADQTLGGQLTNVYYVADDIAVGSDVYQATIGIPKGKTVQIFAIANEQQLWDLDDRNMTVAGLYQKRIDYQDGAPLLDIAPPFVMFGESGLISSADEVIAEIGLKRTVAKLSLKLKYLHADVVASGKGIITINDVSVRMLPRNPYLGEGMLFDNADKKAFVPTVVKPFKPTFLQDTETGENIGFITQPGDELVFYVPEHRISDVDNYTYIQINGERIIGDVPFAISYRIVVGDGVGKFYEKDEPFWPDQMTLEDLTVSRNTHYMFDATIRTTGMLSTMQVLIQAEDWKEGGTVDGDIPAPPYLNVSVLTAGISMAGGATVCFWSNQPQESIYVEESGVLPSGEKFTVNDMLNTEIHFVGSNTTLTGMLEIGLSPNFSGEKGVYKIYLNAGGLKREIKVIVENIL